MRAEDEMDVVGTIEGGQNVVDAFDDCGDVIGMVVEMVNDFYGRASAGIGDSIR